MRVVNRLVSLAVVVALAAVSFPARGVETAARKIVPFNDDWRFSGPQNGPIAGAESPLFSDGMWRTLSVPHDWSIETPLDNNAAGVAGSFMSGGIGYYRKTFATPADAEGKRVCVDFDGVFQDATVYINGQALGTHVYGYGSFQEDLTGKLNGAGQNNVLVVKVDDSVLPSARWYAGAGINRNVRLVTTRGMHLERNATFIATAKSSADSATLHVETVVVNQEKADATARLEIELFGPDGKSVGTTRVQGKSIAVGKSEKFSQDIAVSSPQLWGFDSPNLYQVVVRVLTGDGNGLLSDDEVTRVGIRTTEFKADTGFWINGKNVKLRGVCLHSDGGAVGTAVPMGVWERRLTILRGMGVNAIRTAHNAPDPAFLDLCDRMGFVVMHELFDSWEGKKVAGDYARFFRANFQKDLADVVMRDRNHPSIVIYSAGNEIHDSEASQMQTLAEMIKIYHSLDPGRPVTQALFRPATSGAYTNGHAAMLDVLGVNYRPDELTDFHRTHPDAKTIGTEDNFNANELLAGRDAPSLSGIFIWSGVDYLGEGKTPPSIAQGFGLINRINDPRLRAYHHQSFWVTEPMLKIGRDEPTGARGSTNDTGGDTVMNWTPANLSPHTETVVVASNCDTVELFLNGQSLGSEPRPATWADRTWKVNFAAGTLKAVGKNKGVVVANDELRTAGKVTKLQVTADQMKLSPAFDDVSYVRVEATDDNGVVNPNANDTVTFKVEGPGIIAGVDNGSLDSHEMFHANTRTVFYGKAAAIIKASAATGKITVTASAPGLTGVSVTLQAAPVDEHAGAR